MNMTISQKHELSIKVKQKNAYESLRILVNRYFLYPVTRVVSLWLEFNQKANQKEQLLQHTILICRLVGCLQYKSGLQFLGFII